MALNDDTLTETTFSEPDYNTQRDLLAERRKRAAALIDQQPQDKVINGLLIRENPAAGFARGLAGGYMSSSADAELKALNQKRQQAQTDWRSEYDAATDPAEKRRLLSRADQQGLRHQLEAQFLTADEQRAAAAQEKQLTRESTAAEKASQREFLASQNDLNRQNKLDTRQITIDNRQPQRDQFQLVTNEDGSVSRVNMQSGEAAPVAGVKKATPATKLTAGQQKALDDSDVFLGHIDNALDLVKNNPKSLGLKTMIPDVALQRIDPEGVATRAAVGGLAATKVHELSGAAVSAAEFKRLRPYLPAEGDDPETVTKKLQGLRIEAQRIKDRHAKGATTPRADKPTVVRTGNIDGRKVQMMSDGSTRYAD